MTQASKIAIKLNPTEDGVFERESFFGLGPFKAKVNDDESLTIAVPDQDVEICTQSDNGHGPYWPVSMYGGKSFATMVNHEKYGTYLRLKLGADVSLPEEVMTKVTEFQSKAPKSKFKNYKKTTKATTKSGANTELWK